MGPAVISESRSIANKVDECLRSEVISSDELDSLMNRVVRNRAKVLALYAEYLDA